MKDFYVGQIFEDEYPVEAADWCNLNGKTIVEIEQENGVRRFEIQELPAPTREEISALREQAYIKEVDVLHAQKSRKTILGTWTEEDEENYISEVKRRSEDIANRYPYSEEE